LRISDFGLRNQGKKRLGEQPTLDIYGSGRRLPPQKGPSRSDR
jgi:hypothetical protein